MKAKFAKGQKALMSGLCFAFVLPLTLQAQEMPSCNQHLYLTFDTGHMGVADLVAEVLQRHSVRVTFFAANEATKRGDGSLGDSWAPWWKARAQEGHQFASHTWDHTYWRADQEADGQVQFRVRPSQGSRANQTFTLTAQQMCAEIQKAEDRLQKITGKAPLPLWRAPGGKTSALLLQTAKACGYAHVGWSAAGFLGDELPSEKFSNQALLKQALERIRGGDILLAHLGIWSRKDAWAPAVLEPLLVGLKEKGFCFRTLDEHPQYAEWIRSNRPVALQQTSSGR